MAYKAKFQTILFGEPSLFTSPKPKKENSKPIDSVDINSITFSAASSMVIEENESVLHMEQSESIEIVDHAEPTQPTQAEQLSDSMDVFARLEELELTDELSNISSEDREFCVDLQQQYDRTIAYFYKMKEDVHEVSDKLASIYSLNYETEKNLKSVKSNFVRTIKYFFQEKYSITLEFEGMFEDERYSDFYYSEIIQQIEEQLGGLNFMEKNIQEVKQACKKHAYSEKYVEIKSKVLSLKSYIRYDTFFEKLSLDNHFREPFDNLIKALELFDNRSFALNAKYPELYNHMYQDYSVFKKYKLDGEKVLYFQMYQNKKINIGFDSYESARQFCREYLLIEI